MPESRPADVFVVDDDPAVRDSICAIVTAMGHRCLTFESAEDLLGRNGLSECDCLLIDHNLPGMNGTDLLIELQQRESYPPSALYTGQTNSYVQATARLKGIPILQKGEDAAVIADHLARVLPS